MLAAIRDSLSPEDEVRKRRIQNFYLTNDGYNELDFFKLLPTQVDRAAYIPLIKGAPQFPDSQFKKAYTFFQKRLKGADDEGAALEIAQLLDIVEKRLWVVMINLSENDNPYLIFESLNFKGAPLEPADLVGNSFFMRFPVNEQPEVYDSLWLPMQERLSTSLTEFMRHYLNSEGEEVRKGDVYSVIKNVVGDSNPASIRIMLARMERLSVFYGRITGLIRSRTPCCDLTLLDSAI